MIHLIRVSVFSFIIPHNFPQSPAKSEKSRKFPKSYCMLLVIVFLMSGSRYENKFW